MVLCSLLMAPGLVMSAGAHPAPWWAQLLVVAGQSVFFVAQVRVLRSRLSSPLPSSWADGAAGSLAASALLAALFTRTVEHATGGGQLHAVLALTALGSSLCGLALAVTTTLLSGTVGDRRVPLMVVASACGLALQVLLLVRVAHPASVWDAGVLALIGAGMVNLVLLLRVPAPTFTPQHAGWSKDVVSMAVSAGDAVVVLVVASAVHLPVGAVVLAVLALVMVGVKSVLVGREVLALHGSHQAALTDELTGLPNRRALSVRLAAAVDEPDRPVALLLLDLNGFKQVNDVLGHQVGDQLLHAVAVRLQAVVPPSGLLARLGGDEFAVVLDGPVAGAAEQVAAAVWAALAVPFDLSGRQVHAPASVGIARRAPDGLTAEEADAGAELLRAADVAMYAAKAARSGPVVHDPALDGAAHAALDAAEQLRAALELGQLVVHYQPQVDVGSGGVRGCEALLRWQHPTRGLLGPEAVLPVAAQVGLTAEVTHLVLSQAVRQAAAWDREGLGLTVSVNLAASDVEPGLVGLVSDLLDREQLPPSRLVLELTETSLLDDLDDAAVVLGALVRRGVEVSIDDFGTGWSSMSLLLRLPVAEVKVDRSFVTHLDSDPASAAVVGAVVDLAHGLGLRVAAEGVETPEVLERLRHRGVDVSQGRLHAPALPGGQVAPWLAAHDLVGAGTPSGAAG